MSRKKIILILIATFIIITGIFFSPIFSVKKIEVLGSTRFDKGYIVKKSELDLNKNIYLLSKKNMKEKLLENPYIKNVEISVEFPSTLKVAINERVEVAALQYQGKYVLIDEEGVALRVEEDIKKADKPLFSGVKLTRVQLGQPTGIKEKEIFKSISRFINAAENARIISNISEINIKDKNNIFILTTQGIQVLIGKGENLEYKFLELNQILLNLYSKNITTGIIDMRFNGYPVYRVR